MTNFVRVDEAPENVDEVSELVIHETDFANEIEELNYRGGRSGQTAPSQLRAIIGKIAEKYDHTLNQYTINLKTYTGLPYESNNELALIIQRIFKEQNPDTIYKVMDKKLRDRSPAIDLIYYVSDSLDGTQAFMHNGINRVDLDDVKKPKKKVAKKVSKKPGPSK